MTPNLINSWQHADDDDTAYGQIEVEGNAVATVIALSSSDFSNKVQLTIFDTDGASKNMTPANASDDITVLKPGAYLVHAVLSLTGTAANVISAAIFRNNGAKQISPRTTKKIETTDVDCHIVLTAIFVLGLDTIEVWVQNETGGANITVTDAVLTAIKI